MKALVTGVAGFVGSHLAQRLLNEGMDVVGVDCFTDYYDPRIKHDNLSSVLGHARFEFLELDLAREELGTALDGVELIFHQAAQAGVRASWGKQFAVYTHHNLLGTQMLLEQCKGRELRRLVFASSSSVYGDAEALPTSEDARPAPMSPYGVTKLASEHLCLLYQRNYGVPAVALRYFTVFGPRQRPDMAFHRLLRSALLQDEFELYGDGMQTRDFTYISDIVEGNLLAALNGTDGAVYNLGGGNRTDMNSVIELIQQIAGSMPVVQRRQTAKGDVRHTAADISRAAADLGFAPHVDLREGLGNEWEWIKHIYG
ncbi:MAG: NAD-dependent epimerase/dehydratase family protein [Candidatus Alcyoniella australis]|nr:NAD-dependent epimerase/dehydratase family protein [Candidatus Alcyoniella australis]